MRSGLPSDRQREDDGEDEDYRRDDRYDVRRGQRSRDKEHVGILSILYYVFGGLGVFGGLFPLIYVFMGIMFLNTTFPSGPGGAGPGGAGPGGPAPALFGWIFIIMGSTFSLLVWTMAACALLTGYNLAHKRRYYFCFVIACICCASVPLGTILGVFTIIVLARPSVKELFDQGPTETLNPEEQ